MMDLSIVIVSWNTREILRDCLASIYTETNDIDFEVIVIDNASEDESVKMVKQDFGDVVLIENDDNKGFAAANNQGFAIARGRYVLMLNSDTIVLEGATKKAVDFADKHQEAGIVGCRVLNADMSGQPNCFQFPSLMNMFLSTTYLYKLFAKNRFFGREKMTWWDYGQIREVDAVTGCFILARSEAMEQVGLLDEGYYMYGEETDWCYRFKQFGWKVIYTPEARIIHLGGQSSKRVRTEMTIAVRLSILRFMRKHHSWFAHKMAVVMMAMFFGLRIPVWFVRQFGKERKQYARAKLWAYLQGIGRVLGKTEYRRA